MSMRNPFATRQFDFGHELVVDLFAGGGGASLGIEQALGRSPDIAVNHSADAVAMHAANHPATTHLQCDVFEVDPLAATGGRPVGLLWASPDCKHFSKAKGGKPRSKKIRSLAWVVVKWATVVRPRVIMLENVEEFVTWGPLGPDNQPCPRRKGQTFNRWIAQLRACGNSVCPPMARALVDANLGAVYAEAELATGLIYRQLDKSIAACRRRGWLDENDFPTPDGAAALLRHNAKGERCR